MTTPNYSYGAFSSGGSAPVPAVPQRPAAVERGFWLLIASAIVSVIVLILSMVTLTSNEGRADLAAAGGLTGDDVDFAVTIGLVTVIVIGVISLAVNVLFAVFARMGHSWARIVMAVFAGLSLTALFGVDGSVESILSLVSLLLLIAGVVLLFLAPANAYYSQMQAYRQAKKMGYAG
ncbi:hypothetical protein [Arthrobacter yangruifuii]|uniref:hypothetical protein n=1 Tax=Arthrobacter yangruifuii TaxID=2606616 RepID=UPI0011B3663E|nr:hypothetical protein [Arthrobacter yangruifuii]